MKTLLELLSEQEEQIRMWVDDNEDATPNELNIANSIIISLQINMGCID